ncbi:alpha/beta hydrolase [Luteolibacter sp. Populi]|uniref:alpha/beta hydrolase n=1 Tax=Luteolibacter sp. Populi TaxID=3230487 RepID=UPI0034659CAE
MPPFRNALIAITTGFCLASGAHGLDAGGDGMSDIWQWKWTISDGDGDSDPDGDGVINREEARWRTNPHDRDSSPILSFDRTGDSIEAAFVPPQAGQRLQFEWSSDLVEWRPLGEEVLHQAAATVPVTRRLPVTAGGRSFIRARMIEEDADADELTLWEEIVIGSDDTPLPGEEELPGGLSDAERFHYGIPDAKQDSDMDGLSDEQELLHRGSDPQQYDSPFDWTDSDGDGMANGYEKRYGLDPAIHDNPEQDADGDGLPLSIEAAIGTDPYDTDSDWDGFSDYDEYNGIAGSNPNSAAPGDVFRASFGVRSSPGSRFSVPERFRPLFNEGDFGQLELAYHWGPQYYPTHLHPDPNGAARNRIEWENAAQAIDGAPYGSPTGDALVEHLRGITPAASSMPRSLGSTNVSFSTSYSTRYLRLPVKVVEYPWNGNPANYLVETKYDFVHELLVDRGEYDLQAAAAPRGSLRWRREKLTRILDDHGRAATAAQLSRYTELDREIVWETFSGAGPSAAMESNMIDEESRASHFSRFNLLPNQDDTTPLVSRDREVFLESPDYDPEDTYTPFGWMFRETFDYRQTGEWQTIFNVIHQHNSVVTIGDRLSRVWMMVPGGSNPYASWPKRELIVSNAQGFTQHLELVRDDLEDPDDYPNQFGPAAMFADRIYMNKHYQESTELRETAQIPQAEAGFDGDQFEELGSDYLAKTIIATNGPAGSEIGLTAHLAIMDRATLPEAAKVVAWNATSGTATSRDDSSCIHIAGETPGVVTASLEGNILWEWKFIAGPIFRPDWDGDGELTAAETQQTGESNPYQWWVNDDSDGGGSPDSADQVVNGEADLKDWFPLEIKLDELLEEWPAGSYQYSLANRDGDAFGFLELTGVSSSGVRDYLKNPVTRAALADRAHAVTSSSGTQLGAGWLTAAAQGQGILLCERRKHSSRPLELRISRGGLPVARCKFHCSSDTGILYPDRNRDGVIDFEVDSPSFGGERFVWWVNDDDDAGEHQARELLDALFIDSGTVRDTGRVFLDKKGPIPDVPGRVILDSEDRVSGLPWWLDSRNRQVDGLRDLVDWFPAHLRLAEFLKRWPSATHTYSLAHPEDDAYGFFELAALPRNRAGDFLRNVVVGRQLADQLHKVTSREGTPLSPATLEAAAADSGIVLFECRKPTSIGMELRISDGSSLVGRFLIPMDARPVASLLSDLNMVDRLHPLPPPEDEIHAEFPQRRRGVYSRTVIPAKFRTNKMVAFIHGYNVDQTSAVGWNTETFKRLHQAGSNARFIGVTWDGYSHGAANFYDASKNAFVTSEFLKDDLEPLREGRELVVIAHSLGNLVAANAIAREGLDASKYLMVDAAIPIESYDAAQTEVNGVNMKERMTPPDWRYLEEGHSHVFAWNWAGLFSPGDARSRISWGNRFQAAASRSYNFYSSGENVLGDPNPDAWTLYYLLEAFTDRSWVAQNFCKGLIPATYWSGASVGGWGFTPYWNGGGSSAVQPPSTAFLDLFPTAEFISNPIFSHFPQYDNSPLFAVYEGQALTLPDLDPVAQTYASNKRVQAKLLSEAIPAMSFAIGANPVHVLGGGTLI